MTDKRKQPSRCPWVDLNKPEYIDYHDREWGVPVHDDKLLFEFLTLEAAQAGLSWYTVLKKRENYRKAFNQISLIRKRWPNMMKNALNGSWEIPALSEIDKKSWQPSITQNVFWKLKRNLAVSILICGGLLAENRS